LCRIVGGEKGEVISNFSPRKRVRSAGREIGVEKKYIRDAKEEGTGRKEGEEAVRGGKKA